MTRTATKRPTKRRAVGYVRISALMGRTQGDDLLSDVIQREKIEAWASYRDHDVVGWYVDLDVSGRKGTRRPEFERMMADAAAGKFEAVVVYRLTRFARSTADAAAAFADLRSHDVALVSTSEDIDTTSASGQFMQNILFALAEFESERISEEWKNVHANKRARGIAHVVTPMLGYRTERAAIVGVKDGEAEAVRLIFELAGQGANRHEIRRRLHAGGFGPKRGGEFFPLTTIRDVIANPTYSGRLRSGGGLVAGAHEAIVTEEEWEAAQSQRKRVGEIARFSRGLLAGLCVCNGCGYRMTYQDTYGRRKAHYRCSSRDRANLCPGGVQITASHADEYLDRTFWSRFDPKQMPNAGHIPHGRRQSESQRKPAAARRRVDELNRALDDLAQQRFVARSVAQAEYERVSVGFLAQRASAEEEAAAAESVLRATPELPTDVFEVWQQLDVGIKRRVLRQFIDRIVVHRAANPGNNRTIAFDQRLSIEWSL
jgi:site-specific DNA recombinase